MPSPVSLTAISAEVCRLVGDASSPSTSTLRVAIFSRAPFGIASRQVHDDLFDLPHVGLDGLQVRGEIDDERDILRNEAFEHASHFGDNRVQADDPRLQHLLAAEREELTRERGGAPPSFGDLLDLAFRSRCSFPRQQEFAIAEDGGQEIVEVVDDTAGGLPNASIRWDCRKCSSFSRSATSAFSLAIWCSRRRFSASRKSAAKEATSTASSPSSSRRSSGSEVVSSPLSRRSTTA